MDLQKLLTILARASAIELHSGEDGSRHVVLIKFEDRGDAISTFSIVSGLAPKEADDWSN